jgi:hypothetical protein
MDTIAAAIVLLFTIVSLVILVIDIPAIRNKK